MIVLDASAATAIVHSTADADFFRQKAGQEEAVAPTLFHAEVDSIQWEYVRAGLVEFKTAAMRAFTAAELVDRFCDDRELYVEALGESVRLDHSAYDMFYFVLARRYDATLLTMDKALARLCLNEGVACACPGVAE